jgi:PEP-CTERM motif
MDARRLMAGAIVAGALVMGAATPQAASAEAALGLSGRQVAAIGDAPMIGGVKPIRRDESHSVPEPATGVLMIAGGVTLAARKYWRSRRQSRKTKGEQ